MRVVVITQGVSKIVKPILSSRHEIVGLVDAASRDAGASGPRFLRRTVRRILGRIYPPLQTLEQFSVKAGMPYFYLTKNSMSEFGRWLGGQAADVVVVFSMSQLLPQTILAIPRLGSINLHPSFLPEYRGPFPDFWQYFDFELSPGISIHYIDKGEDTGDIIYQQRIQIEPGTRSKDLIDRLIGKIGVDLLIKTLDDLEQGQAPRISQPAASPTQRARLVKTNEHADLIDWSEWPIERVWHVLRGTETWLNCIPQPKGIYTGQRWTVEGYERGVGLGTVGAIRRDERGYVLTCRDGEIRLSLKFSAMQIARHILAKAL